MASSTLTFLFKIDEILAKPSAAPVSFSNGDYKPPVEHDQYADVATTGWRRRTPSGVVSIGSADLPNHYQYSTTIFWDGHDTKRFLFHPADCRTIDISEIQSNKHEKWGWRKLGFSVAGPGHSVLDFSDEYSKLCGRSNTLTPTLLPVCYQPEEFISMSGLSGKMGLLVGLAAFSCSPDNKLLAVGGLNFEQRRWEHRGDWGNGRKQLAAHLLTPQLIDPGIHRRGLVVHIRQDDSCTDLEGWEKGRYGFLLR
jgi:hypothetical protein